MTYMRPLRRRGLAGGALAATGLAASAMIAWTVPAAANPGGYADLVEKVAPAVVYIEVTGEAPAEARSEGGAPFPQGGPFEEFFRRFGQPGPDRQSPDSGVRRGVGSGFIIDGGGEIVTNNHVVEGAGRVDVKLSDGRSFEADVVGTDPMTDIALLKIDADVDLPSVAFGDSGDMRVGDAVIAVGNPFGLGGTVTTGIISATSRNINAGPYDDFIQTDAAINRGNSGGPLFNEDGQVIGVNTAIFSPSGGSVGIGFAAPSDMVKSVIAQIEANGRVERGWLGVRIQAVSPDLASALGLDAPKGALVSGVEPGGPAEKAGLKQGDVIVSFEDQAIPELSALPRLVAATAPGEDVGVTVLRGGAEKTLTVDLGLLKADRVAAAEPSRQGATHSEELGVELAQIDAELRARLGLDEAAQGVVVTSVDDDGAAAGRLLPGDVLKAVNGAEVGAVADVETSLEASADKKATLLLVTRNGSDLYVGLKPKLA